MHLNVQLLKVGKQLSQEELRQERQEITNSVKSAYYSLLQSPSALESAYQSAGVKVQLAQAELQVTTVEDTIETQKENLNNLMGRDIREDFRLSGLPDAIPEEQDLERARQTALASRTEIRPVLCSIFVLDLKIVKWAAVERDEPGDLPLQPKGELS